MAVGSNAMAAVNTTLTGLNTLLLVGLLLRGGAPGAATSVPVADPLTSAPVVATAPAEGTAATPEGATPEGATPGLTTPGLPSATEADPGGAAAEPTGEPGAGASVVANFLESTRTPLKSAAADLKRTVVLPTTAQDQACEESGDLTSPACGVVLTLLKKGYGVTGMPFPSLPEASGAPSPTTAPPGTGATAPPGASMAPPGASAAPATTTARSSGALRVYFDTLSTKVRKSAQEAGDDPTSLLPTAESVDAAVATGSIDSDAARVVLDKLRQAYAKYGLKFTEPLSPSARPTP